LGSHNTPRANGKPPMLLEAEYGLFQLYESLTFKEHKRHEPTTVIEPAATIERIHSKSFVIRYGSQIREDG